MYEKYRIKKTETIYNFKTKQPKLEANLASGDDEILEFTCLLVKELKNRKL